MIPDKQFVFVIGAPRSGTTWLQAMIASHPSVCTTIDELKLFDFFTAPLEEGWQFLLSLQKSTGGGRHGLTAIWTDNEFYEFLSDFVGRVYSRVASMNPEATVLLDKTPAYSKCVEHINKLIPQAKFIQIIRDGRDVTASLMAASRGWGRSWAPQEVEAAASTWKTFVIAAQKAQQYEGRYLEVRYEELLTNGLEVLRRLFGFIGLPTDDKNLDAIYDKHRFENMKQAGTGVRNFALPKEFFRVGQAGDWRNALNPGERYIFDETAGDLLCALGYSDSDDSWRVDFPYQRVTVPLLAMLSNRSRMRSKVMEVIGRALGPTWMERLRSARAGTKEKNTLHASVNG